MTTLRLRIQPQAPLEAEAITPDNLQFKSAAQIANLTVMHGNERMALGDFFQVDGDGTADITLEGDLRRVKNIGSRMSLGRMLIHGDAGMHLGAEMRGGEIIVHGHAGDWAGAEMRGGLLQVRGNAGHCLGGAYRGSRYGMNRGMIIVGGSAGNEVGASMRRGLIVVQKDVGDFAGAFMVAGTIIVLGKLGGRAGAGLLRGTIVTFHETELLPTYLYGCRYQPSFINLVLQGLMKRGVTLPEGFENGSFRRYSGDTNRLGKGEILIYDQR